MRVITLEPINLLARLSHRLLGDCTAIENQQIGVIGIVADAKSGDLKLLGPEFQFRLVKATPQCAQVN